MRLLLDECIDRHFAAALPSHAVKTVPQMGWAALKNGELLARAEKDFDAFITVDRALPSQQNLTNRKIALVISPFLCRIPHPLRVRRRRPPQEAGMLQYEAWNMNERAMPYTNSSTTLFGSRSFAVRY